MKITILAVGKIKEKYLTDGIAEYAKRLRRFCDFSIVEVEDEKAPEKLSAAECEIVKKKEAERLVKHIPKGAHVIAMEVRGKKFSSEKLAEHISECMSCGKSNIIFLIGGSNGIYAELSRSANIAVSVSDMTFPHQLMRLILSEQIYRAFKIINNEVYHK